MPFYLQLWSLKFNIKPLLLATVFYSLQVENHFRDVFGARFLLFHDCG